MNAKGPMNKLRQRAQDGYMTVQALSIVVLLLGTMLAIVQMAASRVNVSEQSKAYTDVARGADRTQSRLFERFNRSATEAPFGIDGTTPRSELGWGSDAGGGLREEAATAWNSYPDTKTVSVSSLNADAELARDLSVRGVQFTKSSVVDDVVVYDIPAGPRQAAADPASETVPAKVYGLWGNAVSTWKDVGAFGSWINGTVRDAAGTAGNGTWGVYGGQAVSWGPAMSNQARFVTYSDDAATPNAPRKSRSAMTARFDRTVIDKLMNQVRNNTADCSGMRSVTGSFSNVAAGAYQCHKANSSGLTLGGLTGTLTGTPPVRTVVVKGDLTFKNNINLTNSQVHFYVDGNVKFETPSNANGDILSLNNVFIYAPNGTCSTYGSGAVQTQVQINGSLACQRVELGTATLNPTLTNNSVRWVEPWVSQTVTAPYTSVVPSVGTVQNISKPKHVFFFERSGFVDQWTP